MGGSGNTRKAMQVLNAMDIPTKAIVDLDFALKQGERDGFLTPGDADVEAIQSHLAAIAPTHSITLNSGWPTKCSVSVADAFRLLASEPAIQSNLVSLKAKMRAVGIYVWTKGTIEDHLGGIPKSETGWAKFNARLDAEELNIVLPNDHTEITDLVTWLIT